MKNSQFNHFVHYEGNNILYNALTNKLMLLDSFLVQLYQAGDADNDIDGLKEFHPSFYAKLLEDRFIVDDQHNEVEEVREIMKEIDEDDSHYYLIINPTMNCNFKCWYCYESHLKESKMTQNTAEKVLDFMRNTLRDNKKIQRITLGWFGGEPLLYFDKVMLPIMEKMWELSTHHNISFSQNITTNGFLVKEHMLHYFTNYHLDQFQITLDGNRFMHDTVRFVSKNRGSYDDIIKNVHLLIKNRLDVTLRINFTKTNLEGLEEIYDDLQEFTIEEKKYINISFHKVWQEIDQGLNDRVDELVAFFRERGFRAKNSYVPDTLWNSCYADKKNHATINYDGNVFKCTARDFKEETKEGVLSNDGRIDWNESFHKRMEIKLKNRPCHSCSILPLCNGGCSQVAIEANGSDFCVFDYNENTKRDIVYRKVQDLLYAS